ncbi:hypothetical protein [Streptomyces sp. CC210A]|uniref:MinD/ParA family ATP-binding protein n=1 Tax=Streptomyces sp. CC210A TaxID=2898184 RepID=UPI001F253182|nr:hypothetical protein [Streptomyces sp. CC210A]
MPLQSTEWATVTTWARDFLLQTPDPHSALDLAGFPRDFVAALPLTARPDHNATALVHASRRTIAGQVALLEALLRSGLRDLEESRRAEQYLALLREDERLHRSRDVFRTTVLRNGTEVFLDREGLRENLRSFIGDAHTAVLVVDGEPDSGRSYTYTFLRHLAQHHGFRPARVVLDQTSTAGRVVRRLAAFVTDPRAGAPPLPVPAGSGLNDPLPSLDDTVHEVVRRATGSEDVFWFVLDDCDRLDPASDVWELIGQLARAVYAFEGTHREQAPRLVLLGYSESARPLPYELRGSVVRDRSHPAGPAELRAFFARYFRDEPPARLAGLADGEREPALADLVDVAVEEVLAAVGDPQPAAAPAGGESYMRRLCTAAEGAVRVYRAL